MSSSASIGAAQGIQTWLRAFDRSASAVSGAAGQAGNGADLIDGMVGMDVAAAGVKANVAVLRTADEMLGTLLDIKA